MTVFIVHPSVLPDLLKLSPGAEIYEAHLFNGVAGMADGRVNILTMQKVVPFAEPPLVKLQPEPPRPRGAQWKSERGLAGRRWGK